MPTEINGAAQFTANRRAVFHLAQNKVAAVMGPDIYFTTAALTILNKIIC